MTSDKTNSAAVCLVICVDTEGPLYESVEECIRRVNHTFGTSYPEDARSLARLEDGSAEMPAEHADAIRTMVSPKVRDWLGNWKDIDDNIDYALSEEFRAGIVDDEENGLVMNWFVCDWVDDFKVNPRRKTIGVNSIFEYYWARFDHDRANNPIYFHHHALPFSGATHHPARNWTNSTGHIAKLSAGVLDYGHFPACARTPIMAPDISYFLDQYFPFDLSSLSLDDDTDQPDVDLRRFVDWKGAPSDWSLYRPDYLDYRVPGSMQRWIGRCLQVGSRYGNLDEAELTSAFEKARSGDSVLVSCHVHDHSPMRKYGEFFAMVDAVRRRYSDIPFYNCSAVDAFRRVLELPGQENFSLRIERQADTFRIESSGPIHGSQPWFCFKTKDGRYLWDNLDCMRENEWRYIFDAMTFPVDLVAEVGVAANNSAGDSAVVRLDLS